MTQELTKRKILARRGRGDPLSEAVEIRLRAQQNNAGHGNSKPLLGVELFEDDERLLRIRDPEYQKSLLSRWH